MRLSFIITCINAFFVLIGTLLFAVNYNTFDKNQILNYFLLLSIAWGSQGILQYYQELYYDFNPLNGKWKIHDFPNKVLIL